ncbi:hypothetical protein ACJJTC_016195 [Scirpophaga incertulas]
MGDYSNFFSKLPFPVPSQNLCQPFDSRPYQRPWYKPKPKKKEESKQSKRASKRSGGDSKLYTSTKKRERRKAEWTWLEAKSLLGRLVFAAFVVPLGRLHCRSTKLLCLHNLTSDLLMFCLQSHIKLVAFYLPSRYNVEADRLTRGKSLPEWTLSTEILRKIFQKWGKPCIDLFASASSAIIPNYVYLDANDPHAVFVNAFSREWSYKMGYIFPPPALIPKVLQQLNTARGSYILIVPRWSKVFYRADLKNRTLAPPFIIRNLKQHLIDLSGLPRKKFTSYIWRPGRYGVV